VDSRQTTEFFTYHSPLRAGFGQAEHAFNIFCRELSRNWIYLSAAWNAAAMEN